MKKILCFLIALLVVIITSHAAKIPSTATKEINISKSPQASITIKQTAPTSGYSFSELTIKDLQKSLGRKLTLKEKISWHLFKKQFKAEEPTEDAKRKANTNAVLGFAFSLTGIILFPLLSILFPVLFILSPLFFIPALLLSKSALKAEKVDPQILAGANHRLAMAGKIISSVGIALILLVLIGFILLLLIAAAVYVAFYRYG